MSHKKKKIFKLPKSPKAQKKALLRNPDKKEKLMCFESIRKYHDSLLFGSEMQSTTLCKSYYIEVSKYLGNYKKEVAAGKKTGMLDEYDADEFSFELYEVLCGYFLHSGDIFSWCFLISQWNCMARTINIDNIGFRNVKKSGDCCQVKYDYSKSDQTGENCTNKNLFAKPLNPQVCFFVALGCQIALNSKSLETKETFFLGKDANVGSASKSFCERLQRMVEFYELEIGEYIRTSRCNAHGVRKGGATHAVSCTTVPPPLVSIALRGEWSMGKVFDVYFKFGSVGDRYLGRVMAGLNPNDPEFGVLPPHFKVPLNHPLIEKAWKMTFGDLGTIHSGSVGMLSSCLASMIFHSDMLQDAIVSKPGHELSALYLFQDQSLLAELKKLVTLEGDVTGLKASGVPPHVKILKQNADMKVEMAKMVVSLESQSSVIVSAVEQSILQNNVKSGIVSLNTLEVSLNSVIL